MSDPANDFRARLVPRLMDTKGRFWELAISCAEPKAEFLP